jgi:hypothetical protein
MGITRGQLQVKSQHNFATTLKIKIKCNSDSILLVILEISRNNLFQNKQLQCYHKLIMREVDFLLLLSYSFCFFLLLLFNEENIQIGMGTKHCHTSTTKPCETILILKIIQGMCNTNTTT